MTMRKLLTLLVIFMVAFHFWASAIHPERVFVKGGTTMLKMKKVKIKSFEITKHEITNAGYALFLNAEKIGSKGNSHEHLLMNVISKDLQLEYLNNEWVPRQGKENYPMVMVNYYGANEYCRWMGGRLPTETEWIYAARGGRKSKNYLYAGSNNLEEVGWYKGNSEGHSHEIGLKKPNEAGLYDMSGNAWEWCLNDSLKSDADFCVHMGGSWFAGEQPSQITAHYGNTPTHFSNSVGFRVLFSYKNTKRK
jgi:formylglycine-generating enzyme